MISKEEAMQEIEDRWDDLKYEIGDETALDELCIFEKLRDEFIGEEYEEALKELGINEEIAELKDAKNPEEEEKKISDADEANNDRIIRTLLITETKLFALEMNLRGFSKENGRWVRKSLELLPSTEIALITDYIRDNFLPQRLTSKLKSKSSDFNDSQNHFVTNTLWRLESYPDNIVNAREMNAAVQMILSKILVVRDAIQNGRIGDLLRDILIKSYNETAEPIGNTTKDEIKKAITG